jgi:nitrile hydratase
MTARYAQRANPVSRLNDVGGMHGFGAIEREADEPPFHHEWEARVFALNRMLLGRGIYNLDEFRYAVERIDPAVYYGLSYYERWFAGIETLLREKGVLP